PGPAALVPRDRDRDDGRGGRLLDDRHLGRPVEALGGVPARRRVRAGGAGVRAGLARERFLLARERVARPDQAAVLGPEALAALAAFGGAPAVAVSLERRLAAAAR